MCYYWLFSLSFQSFIIAFFCWGLGSFSGWAIAELINRNKTLTHLDLSGIMIMMLILILMLLLLMIVMMMMMMITLIIIIIIMIDDGYSPFSSCRISAEFMYISIYELRISLLSDSITTTTTTTTATTTTATTTTTRQCIISLRG